MRQRCRAKPPLAPKIRGVTYDRLLSPHSFGKALGQAAPATMLLTTVC
jgi:hypothetical protein